MKIDLKDYLMKTAERNIALLVKREIEERLPEGVTIESSTDQQLDKAIEELNSDIKDKLGGDGSDD